MNSSSGTGTGIIIMASLHNQFHPELGEKHHGAAFP